MDSSRRSGKTWMVSYARVASVFALAVCLDALPVWAGQNQPAPPEDQPAATVQQADPSAAPAPEEGPPPSYQPVPATLTLRAKTVITVRVSDFLSSDRNQAGDGFSAELEQPLVVDGWVVARRGQTVLGRVAVAQKAGRVKGVSQLGVELSQLVLVDGHQLPIRTQLLQSSAGTSRGRDAAAVGTTTGIGAAIGAAAHEGEGAGIGAAAGAAAGLAGVLLTRGRPTVIPPEAVLTFQLESPVAISTARSQVAFRPVTPQDYDGGGTLRRRPQRFATLPYPPRGPYWGYPWGYYPGPLFFGGFYDFGPRFGRGRFRH
jgi:hypothetical protein